MKEAKVTVWEPRDRVEMEWVESLTRWMDSRFRIPGTRFRFGLDPVLGLIPGAGDAVSLGISLILVATMARHGASGQLILMMAGNILLDALIGSIPVVGQIFDFTFKANQRNIRLLKRHYEEGKYSGSGKKILVATGVILVIFIVLLVWLTVELMAWLIGIIF